MGVLGVYRVLLNFKLRSYCCYSLPPNLKSKQNLDLFDSFWSFSNRKHMTSPSNFTFKKCQTFVSIASFIA